MGFQDAGISEDVKYGIGRAFRGVEFEPGIAGTMEEILYILGILLHPDNASLALPIVFTGPEATRKYFEQIDHFIGETLGKEAQKRYEIIIDDPVSVAESLYKNLKGVRKFRKARRDAYFFSWMLKMYEEFQQPFAPTHENVAKLNITTDQPGYKLAADLRRAFSCIVAGNFKEDGIRAVEEQGKFQMTGNPDLMRSMDELLQLFIDEGRMKLPGTAYVPCYEIVKTRKKG